MWQSALENGVAKVASVLSHKTAFLLLVETQVRDKPDARALVKVGAKPQDKPDVQRSALKNNTTERS